MRWVWKTSFLLNLRKNTQKSLYISCDLSFLNEVNFLDLVWELVKVYKIETLFLDEIHFLKNWSQILKNIYDFYDIKVIFSWSSMINIISSTYDLSRRAIIYKIPNFSLREYLILKHNINIDKYSLDDIINDHVNISKKYIKYFSIEYLKKYFYEWQFWFFYEQDNFLDEYYLKLSNSLKKSIYEDLSQSIDISSLNLSILEKMLSFIANNWTSQISLNTLSNKVLVSPNTILEYLNFLEKIWWLILINKNWDFWQNIRKQKKIYFSNTNIINFLKISNDSNFIWNLRETFFINCIKNYIDSQNKDYNIFYENQTDFILKNNIKSIKFEIWGKNKKINENIYTIKDDILIWKSNEIPLWLFWILG